VTTRTSNARYLRCLFSDPAPALDALCAEYGSICGLGYAGVRLAIIGGPALMHEMFSRRTESIINDDAAPCNERSHVCASTAGSG
jgi:hypothetical protein